MTCTSCLTPSIITQGAFLFLTVSMLKERKTTTKYIPPWLEFSSFCFKYPFFRNCPFAPPSLIIGSYASELLPLKHYITTVIKEYLCNYSFNVCLPDRLQAPGGRDSIAPRTLQAAHKQVAVWAALDWTSRLDSTPTGHLLETSRPLVTTVRVSV